MQHQTLLAKFVQKNWYTLIKQSLSNRSIAVTALLEYLDLHACLYLDMAIAAGDYVSSNLMCYSGGTATSSYMLQWAATAKSTLAVQPPFAAI